MTYQPDSLQLNSLRRRLRQELLEQRNDQGHWTGHLSSSALATATAISALCEYRARAKRPLLPRQRMDELISKGVAWCLARQNPDGGWGDTETGYSNIATTMLVRAALELANPDDPRACPARAACQRYCQAVARDEDGSLTGAIRRRYGADRTFAVPILANCAIAGLVPWSEVAALPCEAALVPQSWFRFVRLPVVSYAIPALVAIGQAKTLCDPPRNPLTRLARASSLASGLRLLNRMQPASGGYLEAIPLTCFVAMSLAHTGRADHEVTGHCLRFVDESFRDLGEEGTWPIDTNLATWVTSLSITALGPDPGGGDGGILGDDRLLDWLLSCQHRQRHPFTGAAPGGWGWSDLSGAVPDADDTPAALLALRIWWQQPDLSARRRLAIRQAARAGVGWLLGLQNRDGGWPTFCRGWGRLPFDRSGSDITAHVIRALNAWCQEPGFPDGRRALQRGFRFLEKHQHPNGTWSPLWFGNQDQAGEDNPVYGTCRVLRGWLDCGLTESPPVSRGLQALLDLQDDAGGWGGGPGRTRSLPPDIGQDRQTASCQETSLACETLAACPPELRSRPDISGALSRGLGWLAAACEREEHHETWPIGFYFAKLWYYEALYPLIFAVSAMETVVRSNPANGQDLPADSNPVTGGQGIATDPGPPVTPPDRLFETG